MVNQRSDKDPGWRQRHRATPMVTNCGHWLIAIFFTKDQEPLKVGMEVGVEAGVGVGYSMEEKVRDALRGTSNRSAPGPGISYRFIKAVLNTKLRRELIREVAVSLGEGVVLGEWQLSKDGGSSTASESSRRKSSLKSCRWWVIHKGQHGGIKGRSALEAMTGVVGYGGGFDNVHDRAGSVELGGGDHAKKEVESLNGKIRGRESCNVGVTVIPGGVPYLDGTILEKIEKIMRGAVDVVVRGVNMQTVEVNIKRIVRLGRWRMNADSSDK